MSAAGGASAPGAASAPAVAPFPHQEAEHRAKYWFEIASWSLRMAWARFKMLPRWVRVIAYVWVAIALVSRCGSGSREERDAREDHPAHEDHPALADGHAHEGRPHPEPGGMSPERIEKLKEISQHYQGDLTKRDVIQLGKAIAKEFSDDDAGDAAASPLMAVAFTAPVGDAAAEKFADESFAMTYGMVAISHKGRVALSKEAAASRTLAAAIDLAKGNHSSFVLFGNVAGTGAARSLTVDIAKVDDGSVLWTKTYPITGADPAKIAAEVDAKIPELAEPPAN
jgi:hypothetical protein